MSGRPRSKSALVAALALLLHAATAMASDVVTSDLTKSAAPPTYRTDGGNEKLPWYQLTPNEFPPLGSEHRVDGELTEIDFVHRSGRIICNGSGELLDFKLLPYGTVKYLNTEADLRDVPPETCVTLGLYQDEHGKFTRAATIVDDFSRDAAEAATYRLDEVKLSDNKLRVTRHSASRNTSDASRDWLVSPDTRVWKGNQLAKLADLAVGDELRANFTGAAGGKPARCCDIWVGVEVQKQASEQLRGKYTAFMQKRGIPARIDHVSGRRLTLTLLGEPESLQARLKSWNIDPAKFAQDRRDVHVAVANEELRTYQPQVDCQRSFVQEFQAGSSEQHGAGGVQWIVEVGLMIEGFRKGRYVRVLTASPFIEMPVGESLYEGPSPFNGVKWCYDEPEHYSYRTDFVNANLPWYRLQPGVFPPHRSHHLVAGELVKVDAAHRQGQLRVDGGSELVDFTMPPFGCVQYHNAPADLADLPLNTYCLFYMYPDDRGAFTQAAVIMDEFTRLASDKRSYRVDGLQLAENKILFSWQLAMERNEKDQMVRPPDVGRSQMIVDSGTRLIKSGQQVPLSELAVGDEIMLNMTGSTATSPGHCTEIWIGDRTIKHVTEEQQTKFDNAGKERGVYGWIERAAGKELTIRFFAGPSWNCYQTRFHDGPIDGKVEIGLLDGQLNPLEGPLESLRFKNSQCEEGLVGAYGSRGTGWIVTTEKDQLPAGFQAGQPVRVLLKP